MRGRGRPRQAGAPVPCVFSAKKFGPPLEMSAGYGRVWSCLQLPRFFANASQIFLYRASRRCKQRPSSGLRKALGSGTKVHYLALGESALELRLVHGFEFEFEDD